MSKKSIDLDGKSFDDFIRKGISVVDFWAVWCGPCKIMGPILDEVSTEVKGKVNFGKVNVDNNQELAQRFGVMSIPTLVFFKDGRQVDRTVGVIDKEDLIEKIEEID